MLSLILAGVEAAFKIGDAIAGASSQNKQHRAVVNAANRSADDEYNALSSRDTEMQIAANQELLDTREKGMYAESMARLSAMESGVAGNSVLESQQNVAAGESRAVAGIDQNLAFEQEQIARERPGVEARRQARINGAPPANPYATGLQISGAALDLYNTYDSRKAP